jgi:hypothetical protein
MGEHLMPRLVPGEEPQAPAGMPKTAEYLDRHRGMGKRASRSMAGRRSRSGRRTAAVE